MIYIYLICAIPACAILTTMSLFVYNKLNRRIVEKRNNKARTCKW